MGLEELTLHLSSKISNISLLIICIAIPIIVLIGSSESYSHSRVNDDLEFYTVKEGTSFNSILEDFELQPAQKFLLKVYLRVNNISMAQAGYYHLKNKSWRKFILSINKGDVVIFKLEIPAGKHVIEFRFEPKVIQTGSTIALMSYLLLVLIPVGWFFYDKKKEIQ